MVNRGSQRMNYSGIDLHLNNSVVSVIDETDRVVAEKRLPNDLAKILAFLAPWQAELPVSWSNQRIMGASGLCMVRR
jgi:hypothetical protein